MAPGTALYLVFIGGNDVLDARELAAPQNIQRLDAAVNAEVSEVQNLINAGARHIVVLTVPDVGKTPQVIRESVAGNPVAGNPVAGTPVATEVATDLSIYYNDALRLGLAEQITGEATITAIDTFAIGLDVLSRAAEFGITNTTDACYVTEELRYSDSCNATLLPSWFYFDDIHPSAIAHQQIGAAVAGQIP
jgi:phospholipase/lecithinase/hemolysin